MAPGWTGETTTRSGTWRYEVPVGWLSTGPFDNVVATPGLSWAGVRMKAQGVQCGTTLGARKSGRNDRHGKAGPSHGAVLGV
eukprot:10651531-Alexandrium_andersonii.AAC.1